MNQIPTDSSRHDERAGDRYYGLKERPFGSRWDPKFFYKGRSHEAALNGMLAAVRRRNGLVVLTGAPGTGKMTLCHALREALALRSFAMIASYSSLSREDFRKTLLVDFGVARAEELEKGPLKGASELELSARLYEFLNFSDAEHPAAVLVVDDAQNSLASLFDQIATFSDFEGGKTILQVVVVAQSALQLELTPAFLKQIGQPVSVWCELEPLTVAEVAGYVRHRLSAAGGVAERIRFSGDALEVIAHRSGGIPRAVNEICDRAIERGHLARVAAIDQKIVAGAIADLDPGRSPEPTIGHGAESAAPDAYVPELDFDTETLPEARLADVDPLALPPESIRHAWPMSFGHRPPRRRWKAIAVGTLTVVGGVAVGYGVWLHFLRTQTVADDSPPRAAVASIPATAPSAVAAPAAPLGPTVPPAPSADAAEAEAGVTYVIEVATFRRPAGAATLIEQLKALGLPAYDLELNLGVRGTMRRVLIGPYDSVAEAAPALERVHDMPDYADARVRRLARGR